jgi:hypothetical protein
VKFLADWRIEARHVSAVELRATVCRLAIEVGEKRVTSFVHLKEKTFDEEIVISAYPIAEGLAKRWWSMIAGRSGAVRLHSFRQGFAVPDIRFNFDGHEIEISVKPFTYDNPAVAFFEQAKERMAVASFENEVRNFIEDVLLQLSKAGVRSDPLTQRWSDITKSNEDENERAFCEAAGAMGIDPYTCSESEAVVIEHAGQFYSGIALAELVSDQTPEQVKTAIDWLAQQERAVGDYDQLPALGEWGVEVRNHLANRYSSGTAWQCGYAAAEQSRAVLQIDPDRVFDNLSSLAAICGNRAFRHASGHVKGLRGNVRFDGTTPRAIVAESSLKGPSMFTLARAIGDFVVFGDRGRSPITDSQSYRQAVGRAFAAELLAPAEVVVRMSHGGLTVEEIAHARCVSEEPIRRQIQNHPDLFEGCRMLLK